MIQNFNNIFLGASNPPKAVLLVVITAIALIVLISNFFLMKFFRIWLQARLSRAEVTFAELFGMWLRKVDMREVVLSRITAVQAGLELTRLELEAHCLAGGNVSKVVRALILAKRENIDLSWQEATTIDLAGRDVLAEVQAAIETKVEPDANEKNEQELYFGDVGIAVSDINPHGQAKFGTIVVDVVAQGLFIRNKSEVEIVEGHTDNIVVRATGKPAE